MSRTRLTLILLLALSLIPHPIAAQDHDFQVEPVLRNGYFPVALAFTPDGRLFYTEKETGRVRMISPDGFLQDEAVITFAVDPNVELGMLGIAVDPDYTTNGFIWVVYVQPNTVEPPYPIIKLVRFHEEDGIGSDPLEMLSIPVTTRNQHHVAGNVHFDEEGYLYLSVGDMGDETFSQDLAAMQGRIHRFEVDGDELIIPDDNPFPDNSTFAYGLRNPFDFDFDPISGDIIGGENGPTCDDEINVIFGGGNYGWRPDYPCDDKAPEEAAKYIYPLVYYTPPQAITGVLVYDGEMFPDWYGHVFYCAWNTGLMRRMVLNEERTLVESIDTMNLPNHACLTDVEVAPDGSIYFTNLNSIYKMVTD